MYLLDTNVISEVRNRKRCDRAVQEWYASSTLTDLYLSVVSVRELYYGAYRKRNKDPAGGNELLRWIESIVLPMFGNNILSIDTETTRLDAALNVPVSRPAGDSLIAATALRHGLVVATRNVSDFAPMGVRVFNPWDYDPRSA